MALCLKTFPRSHCTGRPDSDCSSQRSHPSRAGQSVRRKRPCRVERSDGLTDSWSITNEPRSVPLAWTPGDGTLPGQVGPEHPFLFLEATRDLDVDVLGGEVILAPVDSASNLRNRNVRSLDERAKEQVFAMFVERERGKCRLLHGSLNRPVGRPVQLNRAFRHEIGILSRLVREPIEQLMKLGESGTLYVPMRLFVGGGQRRHVRQVQVQPANRSLLDVSIDSRSLLASFCPLHRITSLEAKGTTRHEDMEWRREVGQCRFCP